MQIFILLMAVAEVEELRNAKRNTAEWYSAVLSLWCYAVFVVLCCLRKYTATRMNNVCLSLGVQLGFGDWSKILKATCLFSTHHLVMMQTVATDSVLTRGGGSCDGTKGSCHGWGAQAG